MVRMAIRLWMAGNSEWSTLERPSIIVTPGGALRIPGSGTRSSSPGCERWAWHFAHRATLGGTSSHTRRCPQGSSHTEERWVGPLRIPDDARRALRIPKSAGRNSSHTLEVFASRIRDAKRAPVCEEGLAVSHGMRRRAGSKARYAKSPAGTLGYAKTGGQKRTVCEEVERGGCSPNPTTRRRAPSSDDALRPTLQPASGADPPCPPLSRGADHPTRDPPPRYRRRRGHPDRLR